MARVVTFVPDLLFGSRVMAAVAEAGAEAVPAGDEAGLALPLADADALVVDLTADAPERVAAVRRCAAADLPVLAFYSHVEAETRALAQAAGFTIVVPRSRMAREGATLIARLLTDAPRGDVS